MGAGFVQEVAEVEQGVSRCQELQESLQEKDEIHSVYFSARHQMTNMVNLPAVFGYGTSVSNLDENTVKRVLKLNGYARTTMCFY